MTKRPPKPEGREANPRTKANKEASLGSAMENARRLIDMRSDVSDIEFLEDNLEMDDRALAIIRAASVENTIETVLSHFLIIHKGENRALFRSEGPLGSFSNKITMAYALGVFGPITKNNLDIIRHLRNVFAHAKKTVNFKTKEISELCGHFMLPKQMARDHKIEQPQEKLLKIEDWPVSKRIFFTSTMITEMSLMRLHTEMLDKKIISLGESPLNQLVFRLFSTIHCPEHEVGDNLEFFALHYG